ncbi:MAG TPA: CoA transferase [Gemmatimonadales bacterium]|nr:CoA transferase [Gemmatimonadales bacterium]
MVRVVCRAPLYLVGVVTAPLLDGVRVLDLSRVLAGPFCGQILAEMGADVIKVEPPEGDPARGIGPHRGGRSLYFASLNTGKRSVVLDLAAREGRDRFQALLGTADVVVENLRPRAAAKLGLDPQAALERHPTLVWVTVSSYARHTGRRHEASFDLIAQAESGIMAVTGEPGGPPLRAGIAVADLVAGLWAALAAVSGYAARLRHGRGRHLEVPLLDAAMSLLTYWATGAMATGESPGPVGSGHHTIVPYRAYATADGQLVVAVLGDRFWPPLCRALGLEELASRGDLARNIDRVAARTEVDAAVAEAMADLTTTEATERLAAAGVPHARIASVLEAVTSPYAAASGLVAEIPADGGPYHLVQGPLRSGRALRPAPGLGEHTAEVMAEVDRPRE